jgi:uncharacterized damage-inducible protein DinB
MPLAARAEAIRREFRYDAWANARMRSCFAAIPLAGKAHDLWSHLANAASIWLARVQGEEAGRRNPWNALSVIEADAAMAAAERGWETFLADLADGELDRVVTFHNSRGEPQADTLSDILRQVPLHSAYHRGQLAILAKEAGATVPATDFIVFARSRHPPPGDSRKLPATAGRERA